MISLNDEISKFQKLIYNKELAQFITVDQMFVGGLTMQTLIKENSFIVDSLKKMNNAFVNYCKLNDKVYAKIIQHQLNLHNENDKLNSLVAATDRKLDEAEKLIKRLYENTVAENERAKKCFKDIQQPLRQEINSKVDNSTFTTKIKEILNEMNEEDNKEISQNGSIEGVEVSSPKRKGKVGCIEFDSFKQYIEKRLVQSSDFVKQVNSQVLEHGQKLQKFIPITNKHSQNIENHDLQFLKVQDLISKQSIQVQKWCNKMTDELNMRLHPDVWKSKFEDFNFRILEPHINRIDKVIISNGAAFNKFRLEGETEFKNIGDKLVDNLTRIQKIECNLKKHQELIEQSNHNLNSFIKKTDNNHKELVHKLKDKTIQLNARIDKLNTSLTEQILSIKKQLENIFSTAEEAVLKLVVKRVEAQLQQIRIDLKSDKEKIKQTNTDILTIYEQIRNLKEIVAKKANFSDIILHIQKKADREDMKQLHEKLLESTNNFSKNISESLNLSKLERPESLRKKMGSSKNNRSTIVHPAYTISHRIDKVDDSSTKLFMCGFEEQGTNSRQYSSISAQNSRRKMLKCHAGINEFVM